MPTATARRTISDVNTLENWLKAEPYKDHRSIADIPPSDLDAYLAEFFTSVRKRDGTDYDHGSLKSLHASFERHLRELRYPCSITKSREFANSHYAYKTRYNNIRMACTLTVLDLPILKEKQLIGPYSPESLLNTLFWINSSNFPSSLRSKWEQFNLLWGDIELVTAESGSELLVNTGKATGERAQESGKIKLPCRKNRVGPNLSNPDLCPIRIYKLYRARRPTEAGLPTYPFYLKALADAPEVGPWFETEALGMKELGSLIKTMKEKAGLLTDCMSAT